MPHWPPPMVDTCCWLKSATALSTRSSTPLRIPAGPTSGRNATGGRSREPQQPYQTFNCSHIGLVKPSACLQLTWTASFISFRSRSLAKKIKLNLNKWLKPFKSRGKKDEFRLVWKCYHPNVFRNHWIWFKWPKFGRYAIKPNQTKPIIIVFENKTIPSSFCKWVTFMGYWWEPIFIIQIPDTSFFYI